MTVYQFDSAIVREPARSVVDGLRAVDRGTPSYEGVLAEHRAYVKALEEAGVVVERLGPLDAFPDSIFVEDPALVFSEGAIVLRPGAKARIGEAAEIAPVLRRRFDTVLALDGPGFADGGDVLITPDGLLVGLSARTDRTGAEQLVTLLAQLGRRATIATTPEGVLHFKSDCSLLDEETMLSTERLAASGVFKGMRVLMTPEGEEAAANALRVNDRVLVGAGYPQTADMLEDAGYSVVRLDTSEIAKIDAGLSCMSLRWRAGR